MAYASIAPSRRMSHGMQLARVAHQVPDQEALISGNSRMTYGQLHSRVSRLANALNDRGIRRGDRIATFMPNRPEVIETYFAGMTLGSIVVPVNFRLTASEAAFILKDSGSKILVTDTGIANTAFKACEQLDNPPDLVIVDGSTDDERYLEYESSLSHNDTEPEVDVAEHDAAFIMYTSGTTGRPKGAVLTHFNLLINSFNVVVAQGIKEQDEVWLSGLPLFHIGGLNGILFYVLVGGTTVLLPSGHFNAENVVDIIEKEGVTACYFVPTQWKEICAVPQVSQRAYSLKRISWGASVAPPSTLQAMADAFPNVPNFNMFGQTEMSSVTCVLRGEDAVRKMGTVGKPIRNIEAKIIRSDGTECDPGEAGEIVYRGPTVMKEYWQNTAATEEAFRGGWFHSGDLCVMDQGGFITVVDRAKDMIISGGENIYCAEVEAAIDAHPKVKEVAVVGQPHPRWVETPVAVIVPIDINNPPEEEEIINFSKGTIASYKKPTRVVIVKDLPRNAVGKVQKFKIRDELSKQ
jgi:O-succinylbenzoate-CoA ligase